MKSVALFSIVETIDEIREYMGISYIKAYLESHNVTCSSQTIYSEEMDNIILQYQNSSFPLLIGLPMYCNNIRLVKQFCNKIKKACKECYICVGGPQVMEFEREILDDCQDIDFVCTGEGEETYLDLYSRIQNNISLIGCESISFRVDQDVYINPRRKVIENLDELPLPYRELNKNNKKKYFYIVGSRGCLGRCTFCAEHVTSGKAVRLRTPTNIVDEIEMLSNTYGYNKFHFTDATFEDPGEAGLARAKGIFQEILKRKLKIRMVMYTRCQLVQLFDDEYYDLAYRAGVECFFVGIESGNDQDMKMYSKKANVADNLRAVKKVMSHNIYVNYGFICFNPYSTFDTIRENFLFLKNSGLIFNAYHILSKLTIMPQAPMKQKLLKDGLIKEFHYNSDFIEYEFLHPEVKAFHKCLKENLNVKHLIDYDSQIYIDYNHLRRVMPEFFDRKLSSIFDEIFLVWKKRGDYLYTFMNQCIDYYIENNYANDKVIQFINNNHIADYDKSLKKLYLKYLKELSKEGVDLKKLSLV